MKKSAVIDYFGSQKKTAQALGLAQASISRWAEDIPQRRAFEIERITNGALKADYTPVSKHLVSSSDNSAKR